MSKVVSSKALLVLLLLLGSVPYLVSTNKSEGGMRCEREEVEEVDEDPPPGIDLGRISFPDGSPSKDITPNDLFVLPVGGFGLWTPARLGLLLLLYVAKPNSHDF